MSEAPLIKTSWLLILNTFVGPSAAIRTPLPPAHLFGTEDFVFQNWTVPCNYGVEEEETKRQIFGLIVSVRLLVVCSRFLLVSGVLWSFVVVCGRCLF